MNEKGIRENLEREKGHGVTPGGGWAGGLLEETG